MFEQVEIDLRPRYADALLPSDHILQRWYNHLLDATTRAHRSIAYPDNMVALLEALGFVEISIQVIKLPLSPTLQTEPAMRKLGRWYNIGLRLAVDGLTIGPLTRVLHWPEEGARMLVRDVKKGIRRQGFHVYHNMYVRNGVS